jgi:O-methyltransferase involved in polyketide biosynthesis
MDRYKEKELIRSINAVSETAFLTLQCHAMDAMSASPILNDKSADRILSFLKDMLSESNSPLHKKLIDNKVRKSLVTHIALRARQYDAYIKAYLDRFPDAAVINIGCGLDNRFERIDNGRIRFFDLDLPDIMHIKSMLFREKPGYTQLSQSVFELDWIDRIDAAHVMLVAEGVFMYCKEQDLKNLFRALQNKLNNPEIVFEVVNSKWLKGWRKKAMEVKLNKQLHFGKGAMFTFGIPDSNAIESWNPGYRFMDDWSFIDTCKLFSRKRERFIRLDSLRKVQWTVHYQLHESRFRTQHV